MTAGVDVGVIVRVGVVIGVSAGVVATVGLGTVVVSVEVDADLEGCCRAKKTPPITTTITIADIAIIFLDAIECDKERLGREGGSGIGVGASSTMLHVGHIPRPVLPSSSMSLPHLEHEVKTHAYLFLVYCIQKIFATTYVTAECDELEAKNSPEDINFLLISSLIAMLSALAWACSRSSAVTYTL